MKKIESVNDLAIRDAAPVFAEPLHVGRPNAGYRQRFLQYIYEISARRWFSNFGPVVQELEQRLAAHLGVKHCPGQFPISLTMARLFSRQFKIYRRAMNKLADRLKPLVRCGY